jgi:hypothetical protein
MLARTGCIGSTSFNTDKIMEPILTSNRLSGELIVYIRYTTNDEIVLYTQLVKSEQ